MRNFIIGIFAIMLSGCGGGFKAADLASSDANRVTSTLCTPNALQSCQAGNRTGSQTCNSSGSAWDTCGNFTSCNSGFNLQNGVCVANACTPNTQQSCQTGNGTGSQSCNGSSSAWGVCGNITNCNSSFNLQNGVCVANVCNPNAQQSCQTSGGTGSQSCNSSGSAWGACGNITSCSPGYNIINGVCLVNFCTPNAQQSCQTGNGTGSQTCGMGTWGSCGNLTSCNSGYNLQGGVCVANVCSPNAQQSCQVGNGTGSQTCNSAGSAWGTCGNFTSCNPGNVLSGGACYQAGSVSLSATGNVPSSIRGWLWDSFSFPIPVAHAVLTGFSGSVSINSNGAGASEMLVLVGTVPTQNGQCPANGGQFTDWASLWNAMPGASVQTTFIVKNFNSGFQQVPTNFDLPVPIPLSGCAFVVLNGGGSVGNPMNLTMTSSMTLNYSTQPVSPAPYLMGLGDEFCFGYPSGCQLATSAQSVSFASVNQISQSGTIVALLGDVSEGALTPPSGPWSATHEFYLAPGCSGFSPGLYGPGNYFSSIPSNAIPLLNLNLQGNGVVLENMVFQPLSVPVNAGDCIVHLIQVNGTGGVDAESQVNALIQPGPPAPPPPPPPPPPPGTTAPMYRFYMPTTGEHFFTASSAEGTSAGFNYEGIAFNFLVGTGMAGTSTIYRCFNGSKHFISLDPSCEGQGIEGAYGSIYTGQVSGSQPLYRFFLSADGDYLETTSINEGLVNGYVQQSVLGFVPTK